MPKVKEDSSVMTKDELKRVMTSFEQHVDFLKRLDQKLRRTNIQAFARRKFHSKKKTELAKKLKGYLAVHPEMQNNKIFLPSKSFIVSLMDKEKPPKIDPADLIDYLSNELRVNKEQATEACKRLLKSTIEPKFSTEPSNEKKAELKEEDEALKLLEKEIEIDEGNAFDLSFFEEEADE